ncbi:MAG: hypothetical protein K9L66_05145 [Spirochaetaceae bacterium]|nr:hypothetical protein [Spirochaetaceae bacterium]MCF7951039.1 hypothetical protein [Spirochaetaceae bacterium]
MGVDFGCSRAFVTEEFLYVAEARKDGVPVLVSLRCTDMEEATVEINISYLKTNDFASS